MQRQARRTSKDWQQIIKDQRDSGLSVKIYSKQHGLNYNSLIYWRQKFKPSKPAFIPLHQSQAKTNKSDRLKINYDYNIELELPGDYPVHDLIDLLKGLSC